MTTIINLIAAGACLNPCFNGSRSVSSVLKETQEIVATSVLILVLMEVGL